MAGDTLGTLFRVTNWGESHGPGIGVVVEGCPPGLPLRVDLIQSDLDARRPGQSRLTSPRKESDQVQILSGVTDGQSTGTPILLYIANKDQRSKDYKSMEALFRPSHADYTYTAKYGLREKAGGGRSSARLTAGSVAAGAIAKQILHAAFETEFLAYVRAVADVVSSKEAESLTRETIHSNLVCTTDDDHAEKMIALIDQARDAGDSLGGIIECRITHVPVGLGEPIYDKLEADLAKAMLSINACKGFELGAGFAGTRLSGSALNDAFIQDKDSIRTQTNHSGGIQGGISNGMPIIFRAAFKPTATILQQQKTVTESGTPTTFTAEGRHDPCVLPRAVPIVEAMAALVLCDHFLRHRGQTGRL